jgi:hypothetical protein
MLQHDEQQEKHTVGGERLSAVVALQRNVEDLDTDSATTAMRHDSRDAVDRR